MDTAHHMKMEGWAKQPIGMTPNTEQNMTIDSGVTDPGTAALEVAVANRPIIHGGVPGHT